MSTYGIKISQEGLDVREAPVYNLILTSESNQFKVHLKNNYFFGSSPKLIAHGLLYIPSFLLFTKYNLRTVWELPSVNNVMDITNIKLVGASGDQTTFLIFKDIGY
jgi:hypothetical protein